jgi:hypothetical protein
MNMHGLKVSVFHKVDIIFYTNILRKSLKMLPMTAMILNNDEHNDNRN